MSSMNPYPWLQPFLDQIVAIQKYVDEHTPESVAIVDGDLIFTYLDGSEDNLGRVVGADGVSITGATINGQGNLILTLSTGAAIDAGHVVGPPGPPGTSVVDATVDGNGRLILTLSNSTQIDAGVVVGVGVSDARVDENGDLIVTLTNDAEINAGEVVGPPGPIGPTGGSLNLTGEYDDAATYSANDAVDVDPDRYYLPSTFVGTITGVAPPASPWLVDTATAGAVAAQGYAASAAASAALAADVVATLVVPGVWYAGQCDDAYVAADLVGTILQAKGASRNVSVEGNLNQRVTTLEENNPQPLLGVWYAGQADFFQIWSDPVGLITQGVLLNGTVYTISSVNESLQDLQDQIDGQQNEITALQAAGLALGVWYAGQAPWLSVVCDKNGVITGYTPLNGQSVIYNSQIIDLQEQVNNFAVADPLIARLNGTLIEAIGNGLGVTPVCDLGSTSLWTSTLTTTSKHVQAALEQPGFYAQTLAAGKPNGLKMMPSDSAIWRLHVIMGQSNGNGATASPLLDNTNPFPTMALKLNNLGFHLGLTGSDPSQVVDLSGVTGVDALLEDVTIADYGQTVALACARTVCQFASDAGIDYKMPWACVAIGGQPIYALNKGTTPYNNGLAVAAKFMDLAKAVGAVVEVSVVWRHGENSQVLTGTYQSNLAQLQQDFTTDIRALQVTKFGTSQQTSVMFYCIQPSSETGDGHTQITPWVAMRALAVSQPNDFTLVGPSPMEVSLWTVDSSPYLHYHALGQARMGEILGQYIFSRTMEPSTGYVRSALRPVSGLISSATNQLTVNWTLFQGPLSIDTTTLTEPASTKYGVTLYDTTVGGFVPLSSGSITNNGGAGKLVTPITVFNVGLSVIAGHVYQVNIGANPQSSPTRTADNIPRCNLRGPSMGLSIFDNQPLYDWAAHDYLTLTAV